MLWIDNTLKTAFFHAPVAKGLWDAVFKLNVLVECCHIGLWCKLPPSEGSRQHADHQHHIFQGELHGVKTAMCRSRALLANGLGVGIIAQGAAPVQSGAVAWLMRRGFGGSAQTRAAWCQNLRSTAAHSRTEPCPQSHVENLGQQHRQSGK